MGELSSLNLEVTACQKCNLSITRKNAVPGTGPFDSKVIFVGEAPGRSEDEAGKPFVGTAGKILTEALEYAGFDRSGVYITNVVKCRPPNNRRPLKEEKTSCSNYLEKELEIIKPRIICVLGNTAYGSLLDGNEITKNRGKMIRKGTQWYFITIHPAAVIYNPELKQVLKDDLKLLAQKLNESKTSEFHEASS